MLCNQMEPVKCQTNTQERLGCSTQQVGAHGTGARIPTVDDQVTECPCSASSALYVAEWNYTSATISPVMSTLSRCEDRKATGSSAEHDASGRHPLGCRNHARDARRGHPDGDRGVGPRALPRDPGAPSNPKNPKASTPVEQIRQRQFWSTASSLALAFGCVHFPCKLADPLQSGIVVNLRTSAQCTPRYHGLSC